MQIKTADGNNVEITNAQAQRVHRTMAGKATAHINQLQLDPARAYNAALKYKDKASHNIKRIGCLQHFPETQQDVKDALLQILLHGCPAQFVDAIAQVAQFQAARVVMHSFKHATDQD